MSLDALRAGLGADWPFETFPEYLDAIEARGVAINVGALVGHTPVRLYVMGEEATERAATPDEIAAMRRLAARGARGRRARLRDLEVADARRLRGPPGAEPRRRLRRDPRPGERPRRGRATASCRRRSARVSPSTSSRAVARDTGQPVSWTALLSGFFGPKGHRGILERHAKMQSEGAARDPPGLLPAAHARVPVQVAVPAREHAGDPAGVGRRLRGQEAHLRRSRLPQRLQGAHRRRRPHEPGLRDDPLGVRARSLALRAERPASSPRSAACTPSTWSSTSRSRAASRRASGWRRATPTRTTSRELLSHPAAMLGLSDAGAHASQLCDAGAPTTLLGKWVREKRVLTPRGGRAPADERARRGLRHPRAAAGSPTGLAADVTVFDPATVGCAPLRRVHDFPAGADRLVADALGHPRRGRRTAR